MNFGKGHEKPDHRDPAFKTGSIPNATEDCLLVLLDLTLLLPASQMPPERLNATVSGTPNRHRRANRDSFFMSGSPVSVFGRGVSRTAGQHFPIGISLSIPSTMSACKAAKGKA